MSNKVFKTVIAILIVGSLGFIFIKSGNEPAKERPGTAHEDKGRQHTATGQEPNSGGEPPTSGDHVSSPLPWQVYEQEIPDTSVIHNMEHGGVYVSYRPDLPVEQINKIKALFFKPFANQKFSPNKAIMAPRALNDSPIIMSSWTRSMKLDSFDEQKMIDYYLRNVSKSPEPGAS